MRTGLGSSVIALQSVAPSGIWATTPGGKLQEPISDTLETDGGKTGKVGKAIVDVRK